MSDIAHLGHVELYTDQFDASLDFFTRVYGLSVTEQDATSAYLRAFDNYEHHSLKLTRHPTTGASSKAALERRVAAIQASGYETLGWRAQRSSARPSITSRSAITGAASARAGSTI